MTTPNDGVKTGVKTLGPARACLGCVVVLLLGGALALAFGWTSLPQSVRDHAASWRQIVPVADQPAWSGAEDWYRVAADDAALGSPAASELLAAWRQRALAIDAWLVRREFDASLAADLGSDSDPRSATVRAAIVAPGWLETLGWRPALGRGFVESDIGSADRGGRVVLAYSLWRERLAARADIVGGTVRVEGEPAVVVGVLPEGVDGPGEVQLWIAGSPAARQDAHGTLGLLVRLREGATRPQAEAELSAIARGAGFPAVDLRLEAAWKRRPDSADRG